ncbi:MAG: hypothetical protein Q9M18_05405, partial [Mariprofundaceae bacterium]|nr:hypothetical protein [Mariprofundaceae bacterium]
MMNPLIQATSTSSTPQKKGSVASTPDAKTGVFANVMKTIQKHLAPHAESHLAVKKPLTVESAKQKLANVLPAKSALVAGTSAKHLKTKTLPLVNDGLVGVQATVESKSSLLVYVPHAKQVSSKKTESILQMSDAVQAVLTQPQTSIAGQTVTTQPKTSVAGQAVATHSQVPVKDQKLAAAPQTSVVGQTVATHSQQVSVKGQKVAASPQTSVAGQAVA